MPKRRFSRRKRAGVDQYWTRYRDATGKRRYLQAESEDALIALLAAAQAEVKAPPPDSANLRIDLTVAQYSIGWLRQAASDLKFTTARSYEINMRLHILPTLGDIRLIDLSRAHVRQLIEAKRTEEYAKGMLKVVRGCLSSMLAQAVEDGLVLTNVATAVKSGRGRRGGGSRAVHNAAMRPFTEIQVAELLAAARDCDDRSLLMFMVRTGARPGEALALRWRDIDFDAREARIDRSTYRGHVDLPKTGVTRRVDLSRDLCAALADFYSERREHWPSVPETVFCDRHGKALSENHMRRAFDRTMIRAGLTGHVPYDCATLAHH